MNELFGISMSTIMVVLIVILALCLLSVAWVAWRRPVIFKLGVRNIPRRKAQTILIVIGLMLSTMIIAAALGTGDTLDHSLTVDVFNNLGEIDQLVGNSQEPEIDNLDLSSTIPDSALGVVDQALEGDSNVGGVLPFLQVHVPAMNETTQQGEPDLILMGVDPARLDGFGGIQATNGDTIDFASLSANQVVVSEEAADQLGASVGDQIVAYYNNAPIELEVAAIAKDSFLSGVRRSAAGLLTGGMAISLSALQEHTGLQGELTAIAISNAGGVRDGADLTDAVVNRLTPALQGQSLGVERTKADAVDEATDFSQILTGLFLILGLFSIAAGILLIVLIFTMLAAERRAEMGMARAVGMQRAQLIQQFISEGAGYALLSGLVGALLGVAAAYGIGYGIQLIFGDFVPVEPHVTLRSMVVAYCLGIFITFLAIVGSSWRVSRLNVVAAIRDLPDESQPKGRIRTLIWGVLLIIIGALLTVTGLNMNSAAAFLPGMSLWPFGLALVLRFFGLPSRPVYTGVGFYLLVLWFGSFFSVFEDIFGQLDGDFEMFFLSGIFLVAATTIIIIQNTDALLWCVTRVGGLFRSKLPAVRTAVAYPGSSTGRTGMTIAMFSLIVFSLVMMATMNQNFVALFLGDDANAGWHVRADSLGANPISDFEGTLQQNGVDTSDFTGIGVASSPSTSFSQIRLADADDWKNWPVWGADNGFITESNLFFQQRAEGYESDDAIIEALQSEPNVAVIDSFALPANQQFGAQPGQFQLTGLTSDDKVFPPIMVDLADPRTGEPRPIKIIGIIDSKIGSLFGLYANASTISEIYPRMAMTSYFISLSDPDRANDVAKSIESALLRNGVQATSIEDQLKESQRQSTGFLYIIQGFMGLGLIVGIAAIGVIAFRSVVERRQQIGVLRALGFQRDLVSFSFLVETLFVVGIGTLAGIALAIPLAYFVFNSDDVGESASGFLIPWAIIVAVAAVTILFGLLMAWIPARQAAQIAPAEALRYE